MNKLKVAFGNDDGKTFMDRHFGDAQTYHIYGIADEDNLKSS